MQYEYQATYTVNSRRRHTNTSGYAFFHIRPALHVNLLNSGQGEIYGRTVPDCGIDTLNKGEKRAEQANNTTNVDREEWKIRLYKAVGWQKIIRTNHCGSARVRKFTPRSHAKAGYRYTTEDAATGIRPRDRSSPIQQQVLHTSYPAHPAPPSPHLLEELKCEVCTWEQCITPRLRDAIQRKDKDGRFSHSDTAKTSHRMRASIGHSDSEIRIGPSGFHPTVNKNLLHGYTIAISPAETLGRTRSCTTSSLWIQRCQATRLRNRHRLAGQGTNIHVKVGLRRFFEQHTGSLHVFSPSDQGLHGRG